MIKNKNSSGKILRITTVPVSLRSLLKGQLKYVGANGFEVIGVSSKGAALQDVSIREEVKTIAIEMTREITPFKDLKALFQLIMMMRREKPDIVHTHTPKAGTLGMIAAKLCGVPFRLHTVAGLPLMEAKGGKRILLDLVEKITYVCATRVYPNSKGLYDFILRGRYVSESKLKVIANGSSNGIDTSHFDRAHISDETKSRLRKELSIDEKDFVFIFVGRLVGDKGINELVSAFDSLVKSKEPDMRGVKLILVGPLEADLDPLRKETIETAKANPNIMSVGYQADVRPYFAISNCLVFPSYREGFPNVVMQAGAMELPSIVTNINGCNEIVEDGINGIIISPKDELAIEKSMDRMIADEGFYISLKSKSRNMIMERYEQRIVWEAILNEYNVLLGKGGQNV